jgi:hypothetical protein
MVYHRDIIKVKTGIHDIAVFQWHEATSRFGIREMILKSILLYSILDLLSDSKSLLCFCHGLCCIHIRSWSPVASVSLSVSWSLLLLSILRWSDWIFISVACSKQLMKFFCRRFLENLWVYG